MLICFIPTQRILQYCGIGLFLTMLRQDVVLPPSSKWLSLPHGISPLFTKFLNINIVLYWSLIFLFNCNFIISHSPIAFYKSSTTINQRQFRRFIYHQYHKAIISLPGQISKSIRLLVSYSTNTTTLLFMIFFLSTHMNSYILKGTHIWHLLHQIYPYSH